MKAFRTVAFVFGLFFLMLTTGLQAQNCYVRLEDASGFNTDAYQAELEAAACALIDSFPTEFQDSFKVFDFGFYLHQEVTDGGYPKAFQQKIAEVQAMSPYYLLFGKQTDRSGIYTKFWVDLKLPSTGIFECLTENENALLGLHLKLSVNLKHKENSNTPSLYSVSESYLINMLRDFVTEQKNCCFQNKGVDCTPICLNPNQIKSFFEGQGFVKRSIGVVLNPSKSNKDSIQSKSTFSRVNDFAQLSITENNLLRNLDADANYLLNGSITCFVENNCRIFITKNSTVCDPDLFFEIQSEFDQTTFDLIGWIHIWQPDENSTEGILYSKFKGQFYEDTESYFNEENHCPGLPYKAYLKVANEFSSKLNFSKVKENIEKIYKNKNGFRLNVHLEDKGVLNFFDLFEQILYAKVAPGSSNWDGITGVTKKDEDLVWVDFRAIEEFSGLGLPKIDKNHGEYYLAYVTAHEYLHQISHKSYKIILFPFNPTVYDINNENIFDDGPHIGPVSNPNLLTDGGDIGNHHDGSYLPRYYKDDINKYEKITPEMKSIMIRSFLSYALFYGTDPENTVSKSIVEDDKKWLKSLSITLD